MKLTQPVLIQCLKYEFETPTKTPKHLPVPPGIELLSDGEPLSEDEKTICYSGVGKLLFLMQYSRPDALHVVLEFSKWRINGATVNLMKFYCK